MSRVRACLLDFGGTLDSDGGHWLDRFFELYERRGLKVDRASIKQAFYKADDACLQAGAVRHRTFGDLIRFHVDQQLLALGLSDPGHAEFLARGFSDPSYETLRRNARILERLGKSVALGIVSNWYGNLQEICDDLGLSRRISVIVDSAAVGLLKPDPRIFQRALDRLGVAPEAACMVGDNFERDMAPAKALGIRTIWLNDKAPLRPGVVDLQIRSLTELEGALK